jgi:arylsulfatase A-like enzyme
MGIRPNILVFVSHDTGRHIGPYGIPGVRTPNADRLAREGVLFENAFCAAPGCCPSRAALFSGRSPHAVGVLGQTGAWAGFRFAAEATHAAAHFGELGYESLLLGLAHEVAGAGCSDSHFDDIGFDLRSSSRTLFAKDVGGEMNALLDARTAPERPFYLQIGTQETHTPYCRDGVAPYTADGITVPASPALADAPGTRQQFADLQGSVNRLDEGLGHALRVLDERGLAENTLVVFTTDHGLPMPREKTTLYDRGIGVFMIIRYPGVVAGGSRNDQLISQLDVLPTLIEAAGGTPAPALEGRSFLPLLTGTDYRPRDMHFAEKTYHTSYDPMRCIRTTRYKYIFNFESVRPENYCLDIYNKPVLLENFSALPYRPARFDELYDLTADPGETTNLAELPAHQEQRREFAGALFDWMTATDDPLLRGPVASPRFNDKLDWLQQQAARAHS